MDWHRSALRPDGLADVYDLGGAFAKAADSQDLQRLPVNQDPQHPVRAAGDLSARQMLKLRMADLARRLGRGQRPLDPAERADLGARMDARGNVYRYSFRSQHLGRVTS